MLAEHVAQVMQGPLSRDVRERAVVALLDAVGLAIQGADEPTVQALDGALRGNLVADGPSTVWSSMSRSSPEMAAMLNGTAVHAHFQDDTDMDAWAHPGSLIVPCAVALAEEHDLGLDELVASVVAGYTSLHWVGGGGEVGGSVVRRGFRASAVLGPVGAAAAAAGAMRLDTVQTAHAIGLAADLCGGTIEPVRSGFQSWRIQNGGAGFLGVLAAKLARSGVATSTDSLGRGWLVAHAGLEFPDAWMKSPKSEDMLAVWQKHFPTLGDNMAAAVAAADLAPEVDLASVQRVTVRIAADFASYPGTSFRGPFARVEQALASTAFSVSAALTRGRLDYHEQVADLEDKQVNRLVSVTEVVGVPDFGYLDGEVTVETAAGVRTRSSRDCDPTVFFRDLETAEGRFAHICATSGRGSDAAAFSQLLVEWLDGGSPVRVRDLVSRLR